MISAPNRGKSSPTVVQRLIKFQSRRTRSARNEIAFRHEFDPFSGPTHPRASPSPVSTASLEFRIARVPRTHSPLCPRTTRQTGFLLPFSFPPFQSLRENSPLLSGKKGESANRLKGYFFSPRFSLERSEENNRGVNVAVSLCKSVEFTASNKM